MAIRSSLVFRRARSANTLSLRSSGEQAWAGRNQRLENLGLTKRFGSKNPLSVSPATRAMRDELWMLEVVLSTNPAAEFGPCTGTPISGGTSARAWCPETKPSPISRREANFELIDDPNHGRSQARGTAIMSQGRPGAPSYLEPARTAVNPECRTQVVKVRCCR
jgi:hypothetical protein